MTRVVFSSAEPAFALEFELELVLELAVVLLLDAGVAVGDGFGVGVAVGLGVAVAAGFAAFELFADVTVGGLFAELEFDEPDMPSPVFGISP